MNRTVATCKGITWPATAVVLITTHQKRRRRKGPDSVKMAIETGVPITMSCGINGQSNRTDIGAPGSRETGDVV
ncbi:hypothetical protein E4K64_36935 [Bradyrhizobium frederickii]|nr:hypothetical protein [Bradyrhizobium frederickii]TFV68432.1 hypothetical protein E4K64_36935 [Bradyrhizobium frederickii]